MERRWKVLAVTAVAVFMGFLDVTIVNVAFPDIERDFSDASRADLSWVLNAYNIVFAALLVPAGRIADLVGRRRMFLIGVAAFLGASVLCGVAPSPEWLVGARVLQAAAGAILVPTSLALLLPEFPPERRATAVAIWSATGAVAAALGPSLGGVLVDGLGWRWVFFVNVPIGLAALAAGRALVADTPGLGLRDGVDWLGAVLVTVTGMLGVFTIIKAPERGWVSAATLGTALATAALAALFVAQQRRRADPIVPARVLRLRSLSGSSVVRGLFASGLFASFYVGTLYFQRVLGYGTVASGAAFLPQTLMVAAFAIGPTTRLVGRFGAHRVLVAGLASMSAGLLLLSEISAGGSYLPIVLIAFLLLGTGGGLAGAPLMTVALSEVPAADAGIASAIVNLSMYVPGAIGLAVVGALTADHTRALSTAGQPLADALVGGYQLGYLVCAGAVAAGLLVAMSVLRPARAAA
jgi:EmrB/QacA subfamily drug resistance transporter